MNNVRSLVSIVIPFYNRKADVARCLEAVRRQEIPGNVDVEIVCVDNGSTDGTREELVRLGAKVVDCTTRGPAAARNAGIAAAKGEIIAFTDSDCAPHRDWLKELLVPFREEGVLICGGPIHARTLAFGVARFAEEFKVLNQWCFFSEAPDFPPFFATANAAFRAAALHKAKGFDETLFMNEDADLCWRVLDQGGKIAYCPRAVVRHSHRTTFSGLYKWGFDYGFATAIIFARHREKFGKSWRVAWDCYPALASAPVRLLWNAVFGTSSYERKKVIYETLWRAGYLLGAWKGSLKTKVPVL
jgi:GT2 family glycosyltransferase